MSNPVIIKLTPARREVLTRASAFNGVAEAYYRYTPKMNVAAYLIQQGLIERHRNVVRHGAEKSVVACLFITKRGRALLAGEVVEEL